MLQDPLLLQRKVDCLMTIFRPACPWTTFAGIALALTMACSCNHKQADSSTSQRALKTTSGFVLLRAGSFVMGSAESEIARYTNESQHQVTLTHDFELATTEVTQKQFSSLMGYNPSHFSDCPSCPVERVSWYEAAAYCNALSQKHELDACYACRGKGPEVKCEPAGSYRGGKIYDCPGYRLPTDAEWEYAYRAGTTTTYYNGSNDPKLRVVCSKLDPISDEIGWYCGNSEDKTHPVAQKKPNPWGLYDMAGNVWEWCHDKYLAVLGTKKVTDPWGIAKSPMQVARGGSWRYYPRGMRAANRSWYHPYYRGDHHGFRPARTLR